MGTETSEQGLGTAGEASAGVAGATGETSAHRVSSSTQEQVPLPNLASGGTAPLSREAEPEVAGVAASLSGNGEGGAAPENETIASAWLKETNLHPGEEPSSQQALKTLSGNIGDYRLVSSGNAVRLLTLGRGGRVVQAPLASVGGTKRPGTDGSAVGSKERNARLSAENNQDTTRLNSRQIDETQAVPQPGASSKTAPSGDNRSIAGTSGNNAETARARGLNIAASKAMDKSSDFPALVRDSSAESKGLRAQLGKERPRVPNSGRQAAPETLVSKTEQLKPSEKSDLSDPASTSKAGLSSLHLTDWTEDPDEEMNFDVPLDETLAGPVLSQHRPTARKSPPEPGRTLRLGLGEKAARLVDHFDWTDTEDEEDNMKRSASSTPAADGSVSKPPLRKDGAKMTVETSRPTEHRERTCVFPSVPMQSETIRMESQALPITQENDAKEIKLAEISRELQILEEQQQIMKNRAAERARQRREEEERLEKERRERAALKLRELEERIAAKKLAAEGAPKDASKHVRSKYVPYSGTSKANRAQVATDAGNGLRGEPIHKANDTKAKYEIQSGGGPSEHGPNLVPMESTRHRERTKRASNDRAPRVERPNLREENASLGAPVHGKELEVLSSKAPSMTASVHRESMGNKPQSTKVAGKHEKLTPRNDHRESTHKILEPIGRKSTRNRVEPLHAPSKPDHSRIESHSEPNRSRGWRNVELPDHDSDGSVMNLTSTRMPRHSEMGVAQAASLPLRARAESPDGLRSTSSPPKPWLGLSESETVEEQPVDNKHRDASDKLRREASKPSTILAAQETTEWRFPEFPKPSFEEISRAFASAGPVAGSTPIAFGLSRLYPGTDAPPLELSESATARPKLPSKFDGDASEINASSQNAIADASNTRRKLSASAAALSADTSTMGREAVESSTNTEYATAPVLSQDAVMASPHPTSASTENAFSRDIPFHSDLRTDAPEFIPYMPYGSLNETGIAVAAAAPAYVSVPYGESSHGDVYSLPGYLPSADWGATALGDTADGRQSYDNHENETNARSERKAQLDDDDEDLAAAAISSALGERRYNRSKAVGGRRRERDSSSLPSWRPHPAGSGSQSTLVSKSGAQRGPLPNTHRRRGQTTTGSEQRQLRTNSLDARGEREPPAGLDADSKMARSRGQNNTTDLRKNDKLSDLQALELKTDEERKSKETSNALSDAGNQTQSVQNERLSHGDVERQREVGIRDVHPSKKRVTGSAKLDRERDHPGTTTTKNGKEDGSKAGAVHAPTEGPVDGGDSMITQVFDRQAAQPHRDPSRLAAGPLRSKIATKRNQRRQELQTQTSSANAISRSSSSDAGDQKGPHDRLRRKTSHKQSSARGATSAAADKSRPERARHQQRTPQDSESVKQLSAADRTDTVRKVSVEAPTETKPPPMTTDADSAVAGPVQASETKSSTVADSRPMRQQQEQHGSRRRRLRDALPVRISKQPPSRRSNDRSKHAMQTEHVLHDAVSVPASGADQASSSSSSAAPAAIERAPSPTTTAASNVATMKMAKSTRRRATKSARSGLRPRWRHRYLPPNRTSQRTENAAGSPHDS
jgi:hypothetical protein